MPVITMDDLKSDPSFAGRRLACLDLGTKTIGLAVSDPRWQLASPRPVIARQKFTLDHQRLMALLRQDDVGVAVIGLPLNMDGSEGPRAQATRAFVRNALQLQDFPFLFRDERLSTVAAERAMIDMDVSRRKRAERIDSAAACFILEGVLAQLRSGGTGDR